MPCMCAVTTLLSGRMESCSVEGIGWLVLEVLGGRAGGSSTFAGQKMFE